MQVAGTEKRIHVTKKRRDKRGDARCAAAAAAAAAAAKPASTFPTEKKARFLFLTGPGGRVLLVCSKTIFGGNGTEGRFH